MRPARFESTPYRAEAGEIRRRLRIAFLWKGPGDTRPRRYRESTRPDDNRANRRVWTPNLRQIERELIVGNFDPLRRFPWSRSNELVGRGDRTREQYELIFQAHVLPSKFARVPPRELDDGHIKRLIRELEHKETANGHRLQPSTINNILARVRTMINVALSAV
jgi:hypothetical protein